MNTKHNHQVVFGRKVDGCPRCAELIAGAAPVKWAWAENAKRRAAFEAERSNAIRNHDFAACTAKNIACTCFEW